MADESGRKGGRSFTGNLDTRTKTARPTSVGPHHPRRDQEDPGNPGIRPEDGYAAEIARNNEAAAQQPAGHVGTTRRRPTEEGEPTLRAGETKARSGPPRDAPALRGIARK